MSITCPVVIFDLTREPSYLAARTVRHLRSRGVAQSQIHLLEYGSDPCHLKLASDQLADGLLLLRAGAWLNHHSWHVPPRSSTGKPLLALGAVRPCDPRLPGDPQTVASGQQLLADPKFANQPLAGIWRSDTHLFSAWLDSRLATKLLGVGSEKFLDALNGCFEDDQLRSIHWQPLDVQFDSRLRIIQCITSLQRGGAERIAIDLHRQWLKDYSLSPLLISLNRPARDAFATPPATVEISDGKGSRAERWDRLAKLIAATAPDLVHTHLLTRDELQRLREAEPHLPLLATVHNAKAGWPSGTDQLDDSEVDLLIACSLAVERDLRTARVAPPARTVWNGIELGPFKSVAIERNQCARELRDRLRLPSEAIVLLALANPRPQKGLYRLPSILTQAQRILADLGDARQVHIALAGQAGRGSQLAEQSLLELNREIERCEFSSQTHWLGAVAEVAPLLAGVDALISPSLYEGLSLAHLEALAAGTPVIATDVGGTSEIGGRESGMHLVRAEASDTEFASAVVDVITNARVSDPESALTIERNFSTHRMRDGYARHYRRLASNLSGMIPDGVLLVSNNFSTGGAQSSARRLLHALRLDGVEVRACVLQESATQPTPGTQWLRAQGIRVLALPTAGSCDPLAALQDLFEWTDREPPAATLLWNVIAEYKLLIADSICHVPIHDVSPGEMNLQALERYFARPRPGLPYRSTREYGRRLASAIVKHSGEQSTAEAALGIPVHVIPNGVPIPSAVAAPRHCGTLRIGTAARISSQKRLEDLLESVRRVHHRLPDYQLLIAGGVESGNTDYAARLRSMAEGLPVEWLGELPDTTEFLQHLDLFVMISEPAGCPNASLEAMAAGLPIIATDVGGAAEQVIDGYNGRLVPARDPRALGEAIVELSKSHELRQQFGEASQELCQQKYSIQRMLADYRRVLEI